VLSAVGAAGVSPARDSCTCPAASEPLNVVAAQPADGFAQARRGDHLNVWHQQCLGCVVRRHRRAAEPGRRGADNRRQRPGTGRKSPSSPSSPMNTVSASRSFRQHVVGGQDRCRDAEVECGAPFGQANRPLPGGYLTAL